MVTQQAKQQQPDHQQHQRLSPRRQHQSKEEAAAAAVADDNSWDVHQRPNGERNDINEYDRRCGETLDEWTISKIAGDNVTINKSQGRRENRATEIVTTTREDATLPRSREEERTYKGNSATGSNGGSTQCSDVEDDYEIEVEDELDEEEEEYYEERGEGVNDFDTDQDGDDDDDDNDNDHNDVNRVENSDRWVKKKVVTTRVLHQTSFGDKYGQSEVVPSVDGTNFGDVSVTKSRHVHVGNNNFYKGPVTIKQFVYTNAYPVLDKEDDTEGSSSARVSDINPNDVPILNNNSNGPILPTHHDYDTVRKWLWTWRCAAILCVLALSLVTIVAVISIHLTHNVDVPPRIPNKLPESPGSGEENDPLPGSVRIIDRKFWNAQPPAKELDKLEKSPTPYVIISHTATTPCTQQSDCTLRVRLIQTLHIESFNWDDIGYNFLVGGDGLAYLGRGWDHAGAHAFGYNYNSIGISFIGTFNDVTPNRLQINAAQKLIELGVNKSKILPSYKLLGHRQVSKTLSPGDQLYKILQSWDHWSPYPAPHLNGATAANRSRFLSLILIVTLPHLLRLLPGDPARFFHAAL